MRGGTAADSVSAQPAGAPHLTGLLRAVGLDASYHRAQGDELFLRDECGAEWPVLDLVGGYGSLLLGHHHPVLIAEMTRYLASGGPVHAQGSLRPVSERLAAELDRRAGGEHHVVLASTGAEAVEAALKHAMLATGGRRIIALEGAFHGKSLGTLGLAGDPAHREPFGLAGLPWGPVVRVRLNDVDHLEAVFAAADDLAAFIFEPVQGEGGVRPVCRAFARRAAELCEERRIPLIADECQTGMGRTGRFLACEHLGVRPDYVVLSKALGGGLVKIAAVLVRRDQYQQAFDVKATSTFAGDELSSTVALKALHLTDETLLEGVRQRSARWLEALGRLARKYPDVIADVRGQGLMLAVEFCSLSRSNSFTLRMLSATDDLALLGAGYLLRAHGVRVAPTLSCPNTLRVQPSAFISDGHIDQAIRALADLCERMRRGDAVRLSAHLANDGTHQPPAATTLREGFKVCTYRPGRLSAPATDAVRRVAWLCHLIDESDLVSLEPAYSVLAAVQREQLLRRLTPLANPVVLSEVDVRSVTGQTVRMYPIMLPVTSAWMKQCMEGGAIGVAAAIVQKGVDMAEHLGCGLASLGQYTSIVTGGGRRVRRSIIGLTTGNTYSLALALEAVADAERQRGIDPSRVTCAVVGAVGNIGRTAAHLLAPRYRETLLLGSPRAGSKARLMRLAATIPGGRVIDDPALLRTARVVVAATSAVDQPIGGEHLASDAVVCDLSVPTAVRGNLRHSHPNVTMIQGGIVRLPFEEDLTIVGFPLEMGRTYGCMAEALLLGFEGITDRSFTGLVQHEAVRSLAHVAQRHGFVLDRYKRHCVLGTQVKEAPHVGIARHTSRR